MLVLMQQQQFQQQFFQKQSGPSYQPPGTAPAGTAHAGAAHAAIATAHAAPPQGVPFGGLPRRVLSNNFKTQPNIEGSAASISISTSTFFDASSGVFSRPATSHIPGVPQMKFFSRPPSGMSTDGTLPGATPGFGAAFASGAEATSSTSATTLGAAPQPSTTNEFGFGRPGRPGTAPNAFSTFSTNAPPSAFPDQQEQHANAMELQQKLQQQLMLSCAHDQRAGTAGTSAGTADDTSNLQMLTNWPQLKPQGGHSDGSININAIGPGIGMGGVGPGMIGMGTNGMYRYFPPLFNEFSRTMAAPLDDRLAADGGEGISMPPGGYYSPSLRGYMIDPDREYIIYEGKQMAKEKKIVEDLIAKEREHFLKKEKLARLSIQEQMQQEERQLQKKQMESFRLIHDGTDATGVNSLDYTSRNNMSNSEEQANGLEDNITPIEFYQAMYGRIEPGSWLENYILTTQAVQAEQTPAVQAAVQVQTAMPIQVQTGQEKPSKKSSWLMPKYDITTVTKVANIANQNTASIVEKIKYYKNNNS